MGLLVSLHSFIVISWRSVYHYLSNYNMLYLRQIPIQDDSDEMKEEKLTERYWHPAFLLKTKTPSGLFSSSGEDGGDWRDKHTKIQSQRYSPVRPHDDHMMLRQMWCWPVVAADCPPLRSCGSRTVWCRPCWRWRDRAVGRDVSAEDTICPVWWSSSLVSSDQREARLWRTPASSASETHTEADNEILKHELSVWLFCSTWTHCLQLHSDSQFNNYHL